MKKRIISFLLCINLLVVLLCGRLFTLANEPQSASIGSGTRVKEIDVKRGMIYDRNLTPLVNNSYTTKLLIRPTNDALALLKANNCDNSIIENTVNGYFTITDDFGSIALKNSNDIKAVKTYERYADSSLLHVIGYVDRSGKGVCGIEKHFDDIAGGAVCMQYSCLWQRYYQGR